MLSRSTAASHSSLRKATPTALGRDARDGHRRGRRRAIGFTRNLARLGFWAVVLLLTYEWVGFVLGRFPFTRPWGEQLNAFLVTTLVDLLTAIALAMAYPYIPGSGTDAFKGLSVLVPKTHWHPAPAKPPG